ncbi:Innexin [Trichinella nativa]|uniref:Innexin n=1 Tax=Trichinella nativa TaxID=6335 RepID=A0A1Y3EHF2_9BILA|nr:Innexin [Trichinella nativa]
MATIISASRQMVVASVGVYKIDGWKCLVQGLHLICYEIGDCTSTAFIFIISLDRFFAMTSFERYKKFTIRHVQILIGVVFTVALVYYCILAVLIGTIYLSKREVSANCYRGEVLTLLYCKVLISTLLFIFIVTVVLYTIACLVMRCRKVVGSNSVRRNQLKREKVVTKRVAVIIVSTLITHIIPVSFCVVNMWRNQNLLGISSFLLLMHPATLTLDLFLYALLDKDIRRSFSRLAAQTTTTTTNMLYTALNALRFFAYRQDDSDVDRLHYWLTSNVLIALSLLVSFKQFGGKPIECLVPKMFSSAWEQYAENFCWAQDTYFLPFDESVPKDITDRERLKISYYQWVPFFLLLEALCFRLPSIMWRYLADHSGIRIRDVINLAMDERNVRAEIKEQNIDALTKHILNALQFHRRLEQQQQQQRHVASPHRLCRLLNLPYTAAYVTSVYLLIKLLYVLNVAAQLLMLNRFLNTDTYQWYGFEALADVLNGTTVDFHVGRRPATFQVRVMGNVQRYSVQCVLVINLFNEKIFTLLWFWYTVLFLITAASFAYWAYAILLPWPGRWFISRHLQLTDEPFNGNDKDDVRRLRRFVNDYLKSDGVFLVRLITSRSSIVFGTELLGSLWRSFHEIDQQLRLNNANERVEKSNWLRRHGFKGRRRNRGTGEQKTPVNPSSQEEIQDAVRKLLPLLRERADLATSPRLTNLQGEEDDDQATAIDTDNPTNQQPSCYDG